MADEGNKGKSPQSTELVVPELVEAIKQDQLGQININILLAQVSQKTQNPEEVVVGATKLLEVARQYEEHRLKTWRDRNQAVVDFKVSDPDEIDKRKNNSCRRALKWTIAAIAAFGMVGAIIGVATNANILGVGLFLLMAVVALCMLGPLATGESISSNEIVRIVNAAKGLMSSSTSGATSQPTNNKKRGRK